MQKIKSEKCYDCDFFRCMDCKPEIINYAQDEDREVVGVTNCEGCNEYDCEYWDNYNTLIDESQIESYCMGCSC